jgi:NhaP-type Na+/H+ or K+/H+ antiporter
VLLDHVVLGAVSLHVFCEIGMPTETFTTDGALVRFAYICVLAIVNGCR